MIVIAKPIQDKGGGDGQRSAPTAIQSTAAAVTTMLFVFHQMGLGAVWLASPLTAKKEIEAILKVPSNKNLVCLIAVGVPDEWPKRIENPWIKS